MEETIYLHYKQILLEFNHELSKRKDAKLYSQNYHHVDYYHDQCRYKESQKELLFRHIHLAFHLLEYWYHKQTAVGVTDKDINDIYAELHAICNSNSKYIVTAGGKQYLHNRQITNCKAIKKQLPVLTQIMLLADLGQPDTSKVNIQEFTTEQIRNCRTITEYCFLNVDDELSDKICKAVYIDCYTHDMLKTAMKKYPEHLEHILKYCVDSYGTQQGSFKGKRNKYKEY